MMKNELSLQAVCQILGKSKRTITRYVKKGLLNPEKVKTKNGILEYRFNRTEDTTSDKIKGFFGRFLGRGNNAIRIIYCGDNLTWLKNIPSKTVDYFKMEIPILASTDKNTDYKELLVEKAKAGLWSETGDLESYKRNFEKPYRDKTLREQLGKNGRDFFKKKVCL